MAMGVVVLLMLELHVVVKELVEAVFKGFAFRGALLELFVNVSIGDGDVSLDLLYFSFNAECQLLGQDMTDEEGSSCSMRIDFMDLIG